MNAALEAWMKETSDQGAIPEDKLIERMWPGRKQPVTATPTIETDPAPQGKVIVKMSCKTKGASIGYRIGDRKRWLIYEKPITLNAGTELFHKNIRTHIRSDMER